MTILTSIVWFVVQRLDKIKDGERDLKFGDYESAVEKFTQVILEEPNNAIAAVAYNDLGVAYHRMGKYDLALENYTKAVELDPFYDFALGNRALTKSDLGEWDAAIIDYNEAIRLMPYFADYYNNRGYTYRKMGRYRKAIQDFEKVLELDPEHDRVVGNLALIYEELGNCSQVIKWCTYYLEHFPPRKSAYRMRARCKKQMKDVSGARKDYMLAKKNINQRHPEEPLVYDSRSIWEVIFGTVDFFALIVLSLGLVLRKQHLDKSHN